MSWPRPGARGNLKVVRRPDSSRLPYLAVILAIGALGACSRQPPTPEPAPPPSHEVPPDPAARAPSAAPGATDGAGDQQAARPMADASTVDDDPMATHYMLQADLLHLVRLPPAADDRASTRRDALLAYLVAPTPGHFNDGNRALAHHAISRAQCLAGLKDTVLQTDEQREICKGEPNMVPVYANGDIHAAKVCIDQFEFPNAPCELPFVWGTPVEAETLCHLEGKRLCTQQEWSLACSADPAGKAKWPYAYGEKLDMSICDTSTPHETGPRRQSLALLRP